MPQGQSQDLCPSSFASWLLLCRVQEIYWAQVFFLALTKHWVISSRPARTGPALTARSTTPRYLGAAPWEAPLSTTLHLESVAGNQLLPHSEVSICVSSKHKASSSDTFIFVPRKTRHLVNAVHLLIETKPLSYFFKKGECILYLCLFSYRTTYAKNLILLYLLVFNGSSCT